MKAITETSLVVFNLKVRLLIRPPRCINKLHTLLRSEFNCLRWFVTSHYNRLKHISLFECLSGVNR